MSIEILSGAAVGSIITIIITKFLEIWQRSRDHTYQLKKVYFSRKVEAAEQAVSMWYSISSSLSGLSALYEKLPEWEEKVTDNLFEKINNSYFKQLENVTNKSAQLANTIFLYFDFESDTSKAKEPLKIFYDALAEIQDLNITVKALEDVENQEPDDEITQAFLDSERSKIREAAMEQLKRVKSVIDESQQEMIAMLKSLREQMREYD